MSRKRVLIVDDEPDIREILTLCLELAAEWTVTCAASGMECLQLIEEIRPDLIVLDSMMPGMDGMETLEHLRQQPQCADVPVVLLSAKSPADLDSDLLTLGVLHTLQKPFDPATISDELKACLCAYPRYTSP